MMQDIEDGMDVTSQGEDKTLIVKPEKIENGDNQTLTGKREKIENGEDKTQGEKIQSPHCAIQSLTITGLYPPQCPFPTEAETSCQLNTTTVQQLLALLRHCPHLHSLTFQGSH